MSNKVIVFILAFLTVTLAHADPDTLLVDAGLGVFGTEGNGLSQVKFAKIGLQEDLWYNLKQRFNVGGWIDSRGDGRYGSAFTGYQLGFEVTNNVLQASIFSGPTIISTPDGALGGIVQFNESIFLGIVDSNKNTIGVIYNHFSSAGLEMPNQGRDFMGLEIKFPFN